MRDWRCIHHICNVLHKLKNQQDSAILRNELPPIKVLAFLTNTTYEHKMLEMSSMGDRGGDVGREGKDKERRRVA